MIEAYNKRPFSNKLVITPEELKKIWLFGVDLTDDDGNPMSDEMLEFYILAAQDWLQSEISGLLLCEQDIYEYHDYYINDYVSYGFIKLFKYPVQSVEGVEVQFPLATSVLKFDSSWYRVESVGATVQLVPTQGTFSSILLSQGGSFLPLFYSGMQNVPSIWRVNYKAGFKKGQIPYALKEIIGMKAAIGPLNIAGDLIAGAGIASKSISIDGLSQSIGTTSSATNAGYGARIIQYSKQIDSALDALKRTYQGINMVVA
jgi:hypothetical protein